MVSSQTSFLFSRVFHKRVSLVHSYSSSSSMTYLSLSTFPTFSFSQMTLNVYLLCLAFNESKCAHVRFFPNSNSIHTPYYIKNFYIPFSIPIYKDLGVIMFSDLTWNDHYRLITARAYKSLGIIRRTFITNSISTKRQLFISLVRSQLSYCSIIWRPHLSKHIVVLEKVQKRATKFILNNYSLNYKNRLIAIHLLPLMYQLELNDLMFFIQSLKHRADHFNIKHFVSFSQSNTRSSLYPQQTNSHKITKQLLQAFLF